MAGFPKLIPAFTAVVTIDSPVIVGSAAGPHALTQVTIRSDGGGLKSEPGYPIALDAEFVHGADYIRVDQDGKHARLDVSAIVKDKASGAVVRFNYTGIVDLTGSFGKVLGGAPDATTTEFGGAFTSVNFESGSKGYEELQNKVYVGSGRFVLEAGKPTAVEYKISEVVA